MAKVKRCELPEIRNENEPRVCLLSCAHFIVLCCVASLNDVVTSKSLHEVCKLYHLRRNTLLKSVRLIG